MCVCEEGERENKTGRQKKRKDGGWGRDQGEESTVFPAVFHVKNVILFGFQLN